MKCPDCSLGNHEKCNCVSLKRVSVPVDRHTRICWIEITCECGVLIDKQGYKKIYLCPRCESENTVVTDLGFGHERITCCHCGYYYDQKKEGGKQS